MKYINFHTHAEPDEPISIKAIISCVAPEPLQECSETMWLSYGIHPWYTHGDDVNGLIKAVEAAALDKRVLAIGESGIDKVKGPALGFQEKIFYKQISISEKYKKPLIIHSVKANNEILQIHKEIAPLQPWILHGFGGHPQEMQQFIDAGFYLSFGPRILYPDGKVAESLRNVPSDRFFLETDHTNKSIIAIYQKASTIKDIPEEELKETINKNFETIFQGSDGMA